MTELRWVLSRDQVPGAFNEPIETSDGTVAFMRLQYRDQPPNMVELDVMWRDVPIVSELTAKVMRIVRPN